MTRIAINGFGRIGRATLRALSERNSEIDVVAINDLGDVEELARLLKFDTTLGRVPGTVEATGDSIVVGIGVISAVATAQHRRDSTQEVASRSVLLRGERTGQALLDRACALVGAQQ